MLIRPVDPPQNCWVVYLCYAGNPLSERYFMRDIMQLLAQGEGSLSLQLLYWSAEGLVVTGTVNWNRALAACAPIPSDGMSLHVHSS